MQFIFLRILMPAVFLLSIAGIVVGTVRKLSGKPDGHVIVFFSLAVPINCVAVALVRVTHPRSLAPSAAGGPPHVPNP
jgi:hypothetical protein